MAGCQRPLTGRNKVRDRAKRVKHEHDVTRGCWAPLGPDGRIRQGRDDHQAIDSCFRMDEIEFQSVLHFG